MATAIQARKARLKSPKWSRGSHCPDRGQAAYLVKVEMAEAGVYGSARLCSRWQHAPARGVHGSGRDAWGLAPNTGPSDCPPISFDWNMSFDTLRQSSAHSMLLSGLRQEASVAAARVWLQPGSGSSNRLLELVGRLNCGLFRARHSSSRSVLAACSDAYHQGCQPFIIC